ncbi:MAG TPA: DUF423 domain-containing protein [Pirellulales bacterium]
MPRLWIILGAVSAAIAVGLGAYHAHGLEAALTARGVAAEDIIKQMHAFETGARYQMYHAIGLILLGLLAMHATSRWLSAAGALFVAGTLLFSTCLYVPVLLGIKVWPLFVPIGGLGYIAGWICLAIGAMRINPMASHKTENRTN